VLTRSQRAGVELAAATIVIEATVDGNVDVSVNDACCGVNSCSVFVDGSVGAFDAGGTIDEDLLPFIVESLFCKGILSCSSCEKYLRARSFRTSSSVGGISILQANATNEDSACIRRLAIDPIGRLSTMYAKIVPPNTNGLGVVLSVRNNSERLTSTYQANYRTTKASQTMQETKIRT